jgi:hypothetical protein
MRLIQTRWYPEWHGTRPVGNPPEKRVFEQKFFAVPGSPSSVKNKGYLIVVRTKLIAVISAGNRFDGLENRNPVGTRRAMTGALKRPNRFAKAALSRIVIEDDSVLRLFSISERILAGAVAKYDGSLNPRLTESGINITSLWAFRISSST